MRPGRQVWSPRSISTAPGAAVVPPLTSRTRLPSTTIVVAPNSFPPTESSKCPQCRTITVAGGAAGAGVCARASDPAKAIASPVDATAIAAAFMWIVRFCINDLLESSSLLVCDCEHRVHQHVGSCLQIRGRGALRLVMAQAACARHEDHRGGSHGRHVDRIVSGAAHHIDRLASKARRRIPHGRYARRIERDALRLPHAANMTRQAVTLES